MKKFFKIFGLCMAGLAGLVAVVTIVSVIIEYAIKTKINVSSLTVETQEVIVDTDYTTIVSYAPTNATELTLSVVARGDKTMFTSIPSTVTAGKAFTLKLAKDEQGNNIGGEVELVFKSSDGMQSKSIKIISDVELVDDSLSINTGSITAAGSRYALQVAPSTTQTVSVSSTLSKGLNPRTGNVNFTTYANLANKNIFVNFTDSANNNALALTSTNSVVQNNTLPSDTKSYSINFNALKSSSNVDMTIYAFRTYAIQNAFTTSWFQSIINGTLTDAEVTSYNAFINTYLSHFNVSTNADNFFNEYTTDSVVTLPNTASVLKQSLNYVFVTATKSFIISDVGLSNISVASQASYNVLTSENYDCDELATTLGVTLNPTINNEENRNTLKSSRRNIEIGAYVQFDMDEETLGSIVTDKVDSFGNNILDADNNFTGNIIAPVVSATDSRLKYVKIGTGDDAIWYEFNTDYCVVEKSVSTDATWDFEFLYPNYNTGTSKIAGLPDVYLVYYISSVVLNGEVSETVYKFAVTELHINYEAPLISLKSGFQSTPTKLILPNDENQTMSTTGYYNTTRSDITKADDITFTNESVATYGNLIYWVIYANSNVVTNGEYSLNVLGINNEYSTPIQFSTINKSTDVKINSDENASNFYLVGISSGSSNNVLLSALNSNAYLSSLLIGTTTPVQLYAVSIVVDSEGNPIMNGTKYISASITSTYHSIYVTSYLTSGLRVYADLGTIDNHLYTAVAGYGVQTYTTINQTVSVEGDTKYIYLIITNFALQYNNTTLSINPEDGASTSTVYNRLVALSNYCMFFDKNASTQIDASHASDISFVEVMRQSAELTPFASALQLGYFVVKLQTGTVATLEAFDYRIKYSVGTYNSLDGTVFSNNGVVAVNLKINAIA